MSTFDYDEIADVVDEVLEEFGTDVTLSRPSTGAESYNLSTGAVTANGPAAYSGRGAKFDYAQSDVDGTLIKQGDQRLLLSPLQSDGSAMPSPKTTDKIVIGATTYSIVRDAKVIAPASTPVLFEVHLRGGATA